MQKSCRRAFFGDEVIGIGQKDGEVYLTNVSNGEIRQLTSDGHRKWSAVISSDYAAWIDSRRMIQLAGTSSTRSEYSDDIFVRNLWTGEEISITNEPARRQALAISGSRLVWQEKRNSASEDDLYSFDIYAYDIERAKETRVEIVQGSQKWPRRVWGHCSLG